MKLKALLVLALPVLAALLPAPARAEHRDVPAMLGVARACLAQIGALRETETFQMRNMRELLRKLASDIDYAETWSHHDTTIAAGYLLAAMDCDGTIGAWISAHGPQMSPLRRPTTIQAQNIWTQDRGEQISDLSFLVTGRNRPYSPARMRFEGEMAAWESGYGR